MSNEVILLYYECDNNQGLGLLDQSGDLEEEPMEQKDIVLEDEKPVDPGHMLACGGKGIFEQDNLSASQLVVAVNAPTPEDPVVPAVTAEAEAALQPVPFHAGYQSQRIRIPPSLSLAWNCRMDLWTQVFLFHLLSPPRSGRLQVVVQAVVWPVRA